jgi:hypothetical protein
MGYPHFYQIRVGLKPSPASGCRREAVQMSICLRRREFIAALGGVAAWPLAAGRSRASGCGASAWGR